MNAAEEVITAAPQMRALALADRDADRLAELLHEFQMDLAHWKTYDRTRYMRRNTDGRTVWRSQDPASPEVVVVGGTAVLYTEVSDAVVADGRVPETFRMPMTQVWVRGRRLEVSRGSRRSTAAERPVMS
jgi:hypothetical protein